MARTFELKLAALPDQAARLTLGGWLKGVEEAVGHQVKFVFDREGAIKRGSDLLDLVRDGTYDMNAFHVSYQSDVFPLTSGIFGLPFVYPSAESVAAVGWELVQRYAVETEFKGLKLLWIVAPTPFQMHFVSRPVCRLEDLRNMKFNVHGTLPARSFAALGGTPIPTEGDEMIAFLARELLDGIVVGWHTPMPYQSVTRYSTANVNCWSTGFPLVMNLETWSRLPADIQKVMEDVSGKVASMRYSAEHDRMNTEWLERSRGSGREIYWLPDEERTRWVEAVQPVIGRWAEEMEARGLPAKALVADARALVEEIYVREGIRGPRMQPMRSSDV